jgi:hypothetical protein
VVEDLRVRPRRWPIAVLAGLALGPVDLLTQLTLPYPWANLANSSAVWAVAAFALGAWVGAGGWQPALAGVVLLTVAVESYWLAATIVHGDRLDNLWAGPTLLWLLFGVLAGAVFGAAGGRSRGGRPWLQVACCALPGAVLLAEAAHLVYLQGTRDAAQRGDGLGTAAIEAGLSVAVSLLVGRTRGRPLGVVAASVPLALIGAAGFTVAGLGG